MSAGGTVIFPKQEKIKDLEYLYNLVEKHHITIWNTVPQLAQLLIEYVKEEKKQLNTLRVIMTSGEVMPIRLPTQIKEHNPAIGDGRMGFVETRSLFIFVVVTLSF